MPNKDNNLEDMFKPVENRRRRRPLGTDSGKGPSGPSGPSMIGPTAKNGPSGPTISGPSGPTMNIKRKKRNKDVSDDLLKQLYG